MEIFDTLWEAKVLAERWRREYNQRWPHSAWTIVCCHRRPNSPDPELWLQSLGGDFKGSRV